jgi:hypothetical protein
MKDTTDLEDSNVPVKFKLSALWTSVMFCYIYADYFALYKPGALQSMIAGKMGPLGPTTQSVLVGTSALMTIPSVMIFLSLALKPSVSRWLNIVFGGLYTVVIVITASGDWLFVKMYGAIEVVLTGLIVWYAWKWPKEASLHE